jgi:hypothetical protein
MLTSTPVIFITTLSSLGFFFGNNACINAFGMSHVIVSLCSFASTTPVIMMLSSAAVRLAKSSPDNHSLVGFLLYIILPLTLLSLSQLGTLTLVALSFIWMFSCS